MSVIRAGAISCWRRLGYTPRAAGSAGFRHAHAVCPGHCDAAAARRTTIPTGFAVAAVNAAVRAFVANPTAGRRTAILIERATAQSREPLAHTRWTLQGASAKSVAAVNDPVAVVVPAVASLLGRWGRGRCAAGGFSVALIAAQGPHGRALPLARATLEALVIRERVAVLVDTVTELERTGVRGRIIVIAVGGIRRVSRRR